MMARRYNSPNVVVTILTLNHDRRILQHCLVQSFSSCADDVCSIHSSSSFERYTRCQPLLVRDPSRNTRRHAAATRLDIVHAGLLLRAQ